MKMRYLGLFALAPLLNQCQPACAPVPPAPVETTTTVAETTTTLPIVTTTTTDPEAADPNPFHLRFGGFDCDEFQSASGWVSMLSVIVVSDIFLGDDAQVTYEQQDGSLVTQSLDSLNIGIQNPVGDVGWPHQPTEAFPAPGFFAYKPTFRVLVAYLGHTVLDHTFTFDDVRASTPACAAVIDTPGVPG